MAVELDRGQVRGGLEGEGQKPAVNTVHARCVPHLLRQRAFDLVHIVRGDGEIVRDAHAQIREGHAGLKAHIHEVSVFAALFAIVNTIADDIRIPTCVPFQVRI